MFPHNNLERYEGIFGTKILPDVEIKVVTTRKRGKRLRFQMNKVIGELFPTESENIFQLKLLEPLGYAAEFSVNENYTLMLPITFTRDEKNVITGFNATLSKSGDVIEYSKNQRFLDNHPVLSRSVKLFVNVSILLGQIVFIVLYPELF